MTLREELYSSHPGMQQLLEQSFAAIHKMMPKLEVIPEIMQAYGQLDRAEFLPDTQQQYAYQNQAGAIRSKTSGYFLSCISRPSMVLMLLHLLDIQPNAGLKVAEIDTGSGEVAAILDNLGCEVHTIEYDPGLAIRAERRLQQLGHTAVKVYTGDGGKGIPEAGPFDRMLYTAATSSIMYHLHEQLTDDGLLLHPYGGFNPEDGMVHGRLALIPKQGKASTVSLRVHFVPLMSPEPGGWTRDLIGNDLIPSDERKAKALNTIRHWVGFAVRLAR
jgi:protein-L-isoaspartate(D-aspartate) O-methyltransferase